MASLPLWKMKQIPQVTPALLEPGQPEARSPLWTFHRQVPSYSTWDFALSPQGRGSVGPSTPYQPWNLPFFFLNFVLFFQS